MRWDETDGSVSVFEQPAWNANGHTLDRQGRVLTCEHRGRCVSRREHDGRRTVLASHWNGKRLNSPNDLVVKSDDSIWFDRSEREPHIFARTRDTRDTPESLAAYLEQQCQALLGGAAASRRQA